MARDSSPFAQRLRALTGRAGRPVGDDQAESPDAASAVDPTSPVAPTSPVDSTPPDEQPTGEFPAVADATSSPVPDAPVEPVPDATSSPVPDAPVEPVPDAPVEPPTAAAPSWLDPPAHDDFPSPESDVSRVDWSSPPDDVIDAAPTPEPQSDVPSEPFDEDPQAVAPIWEPQSAVDPAASSAPSPIWEIEDGSDDSANSGSTRPIWDGAPLTSPVAADATPEPTSSEASTTPAWTEEANAIGEPSGAIVPPRREPAPHQPESGPTAADGPTLSPPVLRKKQPDEAPSASQPVSDAPTDGPALGHDEIRAALPDESEPMWTPTALHEALTLPDDDPVEAPEPNHPPTGEATTETAPESDAAGAGLQSVDRDDQPTHVSDAVTEEPARRWRPSFAKRKTPAPASDSARVEGTTETAASSEPLAATTEQASTSPAPSAAATEGQAADQAEPIAVTPASDQPSVDSAPELAVDSGVSAPSDPGSITSRLSIIGRRGKARTGRGPAASEPSVEPATDSTPADAPTAPAQPQLGLEPQPATVVPPPLKPSFAERAALRRRVKSLRARRDAGLAELGAIVLDQSRFGDPTGGTLVRRRTAVLADLDGEIAAIEAAIDDERTAEAVSQLGMIHCAGCGTLVGPADRFCAHCGTPRPSADADAGSASHDS